MSAFLNAGCRWQRAFAGRLVAIIASALLLVSGCTGGDAVSPGQLDKVRFGVALDPSFSMAAAPVTTLQGWVVESTGRRHGPYRQAVAAGTESLTLAIDFPASGPVTVTVEVELLNGAGGVEFSGRYGPFQVSPGGTAEAPIEPHPGPLEYLDLTAITVSGKTQLLEGDTAHLRADAEGRPNLQAHWRSLDETIAHVDANGVVTTLQPGTVRIVAMAGPVESSIALTVGARLARIELSPATTTLNSLGAVVQYQVRGFDPRNAEVPVPPVTWTVEPATIAIATETPGEFRAMANGQATVRATVVGGQTTATATLVVTQKVATVTVTPDHATITEIGKTADFTAQAEDANGNAMQNVAFTWSSSNTNVATVDANGRATAVDFGTTAIIATAGNVSTGAELVVLQATNSIIGTVRSALDATPIAGAQVELIPIQWDTMFIPLNDGAWASTTTAADGSYEFADVPFGNWQVKVSAEGYLDAQRPLQLGVGEPSVVNFALSPGLNANQLRIVLTWGSSPSDLDSHLLVPNDGFKTHVYYAERGDSIAYPFAYLDVDETEGFGPETITISEILLGHYVYMVNDFTNGGETGSHALSRSNARVDIYGSEGLVRSFSVPEGPGTLWQVFRIENKVIVPINTLSDDSPYPEDTQNVVGRPVVGEKPRIQKKTSRIR